MDFAICYNCGASKDDALTPCPSCGALPASDEEAALSLALTTQHFGQGTLLQFSRIIRAGQKPKLDEESRQALIDQVREMREKQNAQPEAPFKRKPVLKFGREQTQIWKLLRRQMNLVTLQLVVVLAGVVMAALSGVAPDDAHGFLASGAVVCWVLVLFVIPCVAFVMPKIAGSYPWLVVVGIAGALAIPAAYMAPDFFYDEEAVRERKGSEVIQQLPL